MTKGFRTLLIGAILIATPVLALGQPVYYELEFDYVIYGNILASPVLYNSGSLLSGAEGAIQFELDDTGWPTDPEARFDHIWVTYFADNYDATHPVTKRWVGQFPGTWRLEAWNAPPGFGGWCQGHIDARITVRDYDGDEVLDSTEKWGDQLFDADLSRLCDDPAGGEPMWKWGYGAMASNYFHFVMPPGVDELANGGNITLTDYGCVVSTGQPSWGSIKALYR